MNSYLNFNKQELIHHTDCSGYIFCHQSKTITFVDFISSYSMIFALNPIHRMSQTFFNSTKHLYIHYDLLSQ